MAVIFETLLESAQKGELILIEGGYARYHLRRDGQLTLYEILAMPPFCGIGTRLLARLKAVPGAACIVARCPEDLAANTWYARQGFVLSGVETLRSERRLKIWRLALR